MYKQGTKLNPQTPATYVQRLSDMAMIPLGESNKDYQEYLKWLEEGNTPLPADEPNEGTV